MLTVMTPDKPQQRTTRPATPGDAIRSRRIYLGLQQEDLVERSNGALNFKLLSRLENNRKNPKDLTISKYNALVEVLQWTNDEFRENVGVAPQSESLPGSLPYVPSVQVPVIGTVSAGLAHVGEPMDEADTLPVDLDAAGLKGVNPKDLVWLTVNGDSMISEAATASVPHKSRVLVELGAQPRDGDIVVAWLENHDTAVIKQYQERGDAVLRSYNPGGPVFRLGNEPFDVRGVVRLVQFKPGA